MANTEHDWARDKDAFVAHQTEARPTADVGDSPLAAQLALLTAVLLDADSVAGVLSHVVRAALATIPGADLVSVTLRSPDGSFHTPAETDPMATELDDLQYRAGHGPCVDTALPSGPAYARSADLASEPAWPKFGPAAADRGYASVLSTALIPDAVPPRLSGALNVYSKRRDAFTDESRDRALVLATHASLALAKTQAVERAELEATHLRQALDSRDVIGQAKGILMQRRGIDAEEAFELLRRTSQDLNVKVAELARTLATRHLELDDER